MDIRSASVNGDERAAMGIPGGGRNTLNTNEDGGIEVDEDRDEGDDDDDDAKLAISTGLDSCDCGVSESWQGRHWRRSARSVTEITVESERAFWVCRPARMDSLVTIDSAGGCSVPHGPEIESSFAGCVSINSSRSHRTTAASDFAMFSSERNNRTIGSGGRTTRRVVMSDSLTSYTCCSLLWGSSCTELMAACGGTMFETMARMS